MQVLTEIELSLVEVVWRVVKSCVELLPDQSKVECSKTGFYFQNLLRTHETGQERVVRVAELIAKPQLSRTHPSAHFTKPASSLMAPNDKDRLMSEIFL